MDAASVDAASLLGPGNTGLADLLEEGGHSPYSAGDDGYATTVEEDDFFASSTLPDTLDLAFPDLKSEPFNFPGIMLDSPSDLKVPEQHKSFAAGLPMDFGLPSRRQHSEQTQEASVQADGHATFTDDASSAALLQILTQAALQQTQSMQPQAPEQVSPVLTSPASSGSVSPRDVSPTRSPTQAPASKVKLEPMDERARASTSPSPPTEIDSTASTDKNKRKRRVREASELLPLDAPVQKRTYLGPSATSRRELPQQDDVGENPDESVQAILDKRRKNTLAARQSRRRKAEELSQLKGENDALAEENDELKRRLQDALTELKSFRLRMEGLCDATKSP